jgi:hypothetical protein
MFKPGKFRGGQESTPAVTEHVADERAGFYQRGGRLSLENDRVHINLLQL